MSDEYHLKRIMEILAEILIEVRNIAQILQKSLLQEMSMQCLQSNTLEDQLHTFVHDQLK